MTRAHLHGAWQNLKIPFGLVVFLFGGVLWGVNLKRDVDDNSKYIREWKASYKSIDRNVREINRRLSKIEWEMKQRRRK